ncbi:MAG: ArnT family glycosyltransferase [Myxococcales bacterium]
MDAVSHVSGAAEHPLARWAEAASLPVLLAVTAGYRLFWRGHGAPLGGFDERLYVTFARTFEQGGLPALRGLLARYPTDPTLSQGPLPLRLLWVSTIGFACHLAGRCDAAVLAWVSWLAGLATVPLAWRLFRRWLPPAPAFVGGLLVAVSPLATHLSQRALQDSFFTFWVVASVFFLERLRDGDRLADRLALALCAFAGLLTKESMALLLPLLALGAGGPGRRRLWTFAALALAAVAAFAVLAAAAGGIPALVHVYREYDRIAAQEPYTVAAQRGPWFRYLVDLLLISPTTLLFALAGLLLGVSLRSAQSFGPGGRLRRQPRAPLRFLGALWGRLDAVLRSGVSRAALFGFGGLAVFSALPVLSVRYVLFADVFLRALAAAGAFALAARGRRPLLALNVGLLLAVEVVQFQRLFDAGAIYDPVTAELVRANGMVRWP